jgi:hypothetical protein
VESCWPRFIWGLTRDGNQIKKTYNGSKEELLKQVLVPNTIH